VQNKKLKKQTNKPRFPTATTKISLIMINPGKQQHFKAKLFIKSTFLFPSNN